MHGTYKTCRKKEKEKEKEVMKSYEINVKPWNN